MYQEVILDHCKKPRNWGQVPDATHKAEGINPLCGDHIWVSMNVVDEKIEDIQYEGESCAICMASGSMMTAKVKGKACADAIDMTEQFRVLTTEEEKKKEPSGLGSLAVFSGIRDLPSRVKCALLPWHTLIAAINSQSEISTEGDKDPIPGSGNEKGNN